MRFADALVFTVFEHAQEFWLEVVWQFANFIKEQRALAGLLEITGAGTGGAGESAFGVAEADRRAITIEGGMQNSGLALGIIAVQFNADLGMVVVASLWGMWHIVSGLSLATLWRRKDARLGH